HVRPPEPWRGAHGGCQGRRRSSVTYQRVCPGVPPGARLLRPPWKKLVYNKGYRPCRRGAAPGIPAALFMDQYACTPQQTLAHASSPAACAGNGPGGSEGQIFGQVGSALFVSRCEETK